MFAFARCVSLLPSRSCLHPANAGRGAGGVRLGGGCARKVRRRRRVSWVVSRRLMKAPCAPFPSTHPPTPTHHPAHTLVFRCHYLPKTHTALAASAPHLLHTHRSPPPRRVVSLPRLLAPMHPPAPPHSSLTSRALSPARTRTPLPLASCPAPHLVPRSRSSPPPLLTSYPTPTRLLTLPFLRMIWVTQHLQTSS